MRKSSSERGFRPNPSTAKLSGKQTVQEEIAEGRQKFALGQIARGTENNNRARLSRCGSVVCGRASVPGEGSIGDMSTSQESGYGRTLRPPKSLPQCR